MTQRMSVIAAKSQVQTERCAAVVAGSGRLRSRVNRGAWAAMAVACGALALVACDGPEGGGTAGVGSVIPGEPMPPELSVRVLAKVGDREITFGEYVATLARMDQFERLRYQTEARHKVLLDQIIDAELLAREAERRGLHKTTQAIERKRLLMRDELLRQMREELPLLEEIPLGEVREYYDANKNEFADPARRRVSVILLSDPSTGADVLREAQAASADEWGQLVAKHSRVRSPEKPKPGEARPPLELAGDLGFVTAPSESRGSNPDIPEAVRAAAFGIKQVGGVAGAIVKVGADSYIVRLVAINVKTQRSFQDAMQSIRVRVLQRKLRTAREKLETELRRTVKVTINEAALKKLEQEPPAEENQAGH